MNHELKTDPIPFQEVWQENKLFEIRKNDRNFTNEDTVTLKETVWSAQQMKEGKPLEYTGREIEAEIPFVLYGGYGLQEGYCVFSLSATLNVDSHL